VSPKRFTKTVSTKHSPSSLVNHHMALDETHSHHEGRRVERRRAAVQVSDFRCVRPFGLRGKWPPDHQHVSSSPSKIPYSGFSPVRLQTGIQLRPSSTLPSSSARPAYTLTGRIYTRLKSLSQKEAFFRPRTCVQSGLSPSERNYPVQRSLAPQRVCCPAGSSLTITSCELLVPSRRFMDYPAGPCPTV